MKLSYPGNVSPIPDKHMKARLITTLLTALVVCYSPRCLFGAEPSPTKQAVAVLHPTAGQQCHGVVRFTQEGESIKVVADLEGLNPSQKHAFHIHQYGDCSASDGMSAGGHYNPEGHQHDLPDTENRHAGDLGNVQADDQGKAHYEVTVNNISFSISSLSLCRRPRC